MSDASAVQPERPIGRDGLRPLEGFAGATAAHVFTEPTAVGADVVMTAATFGRVGARFPTRGRPVAVIVAGPDRVHVRSTVDVAKLGVAALAAAVALWCATRRA
jgi:hypothetical protein